MLNYSQNFASIVKTVHNYFNDINILDIKYNLGCDLCIYFLNKKDCFKSVLNSVEIIRRINSIMLRM